MALSKKITLPSGAEIKYHVINMIESSTSFENYKTIVYVHSFTSKDIYKKALERDNLIKEQDDYVKEFDELYQLESPTKTQQTKMVNLQTKINDLAEKINQTKDYRVYVALETVVELPYQEDLSIANIQKVLSESGTFKSATIVA